RLGVARRVTVGSDADVAWADAFGEGPGILVVAGTGSVGLARGSAARPLLRVGGWGALVGDGGSAYRIALQGMPAALAGATGSGPPPALTAQLLSGTGVEGLAGLYRWSVDARKADLAALAPGVVEVARAGDEVAGAIVSEAVEAILAHAVALRARIRED